MRLSIKQPLPDREVGQCIYCGRTETLTDEHIIPEGLGGTVELLKASCETCRVKTGRCEQIVMRTMFREVRVHLGIPRNRRKRRREVPTTATMGSPTANGKAEWKETPISDHVGLLAFPNIGLAPILKGELGQTITLGKDVPIVWRMLNPDFEDRFKRTGTNTSYQILALGEFCQMLEKIGYCFAIYELGLNSFDPFVLDCIRGEATNTFRYVGGGATASHSGKSLHWMKLFERSEYLGKRLLFASVQLFAHLDSPTFHVVIGELPPTASPIGEDRVFRVPL